MGGRRYSIGNRNCFGYHRGDAKIKYWCRRIGWFVSFLFNGDDLPFCIMISKLMAKK